MSGILTEEELNKIVDLKLAIDAIGMIVFAEIKNGNESKFLYTILGIVKMMVEENKHGRIQSNESIVTEAT